MLIDRLLRYELAKPSQNFVMRVCNNGYALLLQVAYARQLASECTIAQVTSKDAPLLHFCDLLLKACPQLFGPVPRRTCARNEKSDVQKTAHRQRDVLIALLRIVVLKLMHLCAVVYCIQWCKHQHITSTRESALLVTCCAGPG